MQASRARRAEADCLLTGDQIDPRESYISVLSSAELVARHGRVAEMESCPNSDATPP